MLINEKNKYITHHNWCRLTLKCNHLTAGRRLIHQKIKLGQWGVISNVLLRTKGFITMVKIIGNFLAYNSGPLRHLAVGLEFSREK